MSNVESDLGPDKTDESIIVLFYITFIVFDSY